VLFCRAAEEQQGTEEGQAQASEEQKPREPEVSVSKGRKRRATNLAPECKERDPCRELVRAKNRKTEQERRDRIHEGYVNVNVPKLS
jgi:hypothetical protein